MLLVVGLISCVYAEPTYINSLPYTIDESGYYVLNTSCTDLSTTAITINADNVVLDGNGKVLDGNKAWTSYGVYVNNKNITKPTIPTSIKTCIY